MINFPWACTFAVWNYNLNGTTPFKTSIQHTGDLALGGGGSTVPYPTAELNAIYDRNLEAIDNARRGMGQ